MFSLQGVSQLFLTFLSVMKAQHFEVFFFFLINLREFVPANFRDQWTSVLGCLSVRALIHRASTYTSLLS